MSREQFTEGPWDTEDEQDCRIPVVAHILVGVENDETRDEKYETQLICEVACYDGSSAGEQGEANARLISGAPKLFRQLDAILAALEEGETVVIEPGSVKAQWIKEAIDAASKN